MNVSSIMVVDTSAVAASIRKTIANNISKTVSAAALHNLSSLCLTEEQMAMLVFILF